MSKQKHNIPVLYDFKKYETPRVGLFNVPKERGKYNSLTGWENNIIEVQIIGEDTTSYVYQLKETEQGKWVGNKVVKEHFILPLGIHKTRLIKWTSYQMTIFDCIDS
jgi:hypothetical protein